MSGPALPQGYLRTSLMAVVDTVAERDGDLLTGPERDTLAAIQALPAPAQGLLARLLTRRGPWFRRDGLVYAEVGDLGPALADLLAAGLCDDGAALPDLLGLLRREEAFDLLAARGPRPARGARREDLLGSLAADPDPEGLRALLQARLGAVRPAIPDLWERLGLMYFGNLEQDLAAFVLADLGVVRHAPYRIEPGARPFPERADLDLLLSLRRLREALEAPDPDLEALTAAALAVEARPGVRLQRRWQRLLQDLATAWERRGEPDRALACLEPCGLPPARERRVRILARRGDLDGACALARAAEAEPLDPAEARFARAWLHRQGRRRPDLGPWLAAHPLPEPVPEEALDLPPHPDGVEAAVLAAARAEGWQGFFAENRLWRAAFGLLLWEDLFAGVPGAFIHPFQTAPLDLGGDFLGPRRAGIEGRLAALAACADPAALLRSALERVGGFANAFLDPRRLDPAELDAAFSRVPGPVLARILGRMAARPRTFASGFPDLFLFRPGGPAWRLREVKGPGDALRPEQAGWLEAFRSWGCDAAVARVRYLAP